MRRGSGIHDATPISHHKKRVVGGEVGWPAVRYGFFTQRKREILWKTLSEYANEGKSRFIDWLGQTENQPAASFQPKDRRGGLALSNLTLRSLGLASVSTYEKAGCLKRHIHSGEVNRSESEA